MRNLLKAASTIICAGAMALMLTAPQARADEWNKKTIVTFSGPVEIPGKHLKGYGVLPAGTYVFKLVSGDGDRHIVQIYNQQEDKCLATILAVNNSRLKPTGRTVITFRERPNGEPAALWAWFYPGDNFGQEFVYPKEKAKEIAQTSTTPVLYSPVETPAEASEPIQPPTQAETSDMQQSPVMAYNQAGDDMELSQAVTPPPPDNMQTTSQANSTANTATPQTSTESQLPQTASPLGWIMLSGLIALFGGLSIGVVRQSSGS